MTQSGMTIAEAQEDMRASFANGSAGALASGLLWLGSAALGTWGSERAAILLVAMGGAFLFPVSQVLVRFAGRRGRLVPGNPLHGLALQAAFIIPLCLPIVGGAALYKLDWFYPALAILVGAHYLPFVTLYGLRHYAALGGILILIGLGIGLYVPGSFSLAGWMTGVVLVVFGGVLWASQSKR